MKKLILATFILFFSSAYAHADVYSNNKSESIHIPTEISKIGNTYYRYNGTGYTSYEKKGNDIYGSDGSHYTQFNNIIHDTAPNGKSYIIQNDTISTFY